MRRIRRPRRFCAWSCSSYVAGGGLHVCNLKRRALHKLKRCLDRPCLFSWHSSYCHQMAIWIFFRCVCKSVQVFVPMEIQIRMYRIALVNWKKIYGPGVQVPCTGSIEHAGLRPLTTRVLLDCGCRRIRHGKRQPLEWQPPTFTSGSRHGLPEGLGGPRCHPRRRHTNILPWPDPRIRMHTFRNNLKYGGIMVKFESRTTALLKVFFFEVYLLKVSLEQNHHHSWQKDIQYNLKQNRVVFGPV